MDRAVEVDMPQTSAALPCGDDGIVGPLCAESSKNELRRIMTSNLAEMEETNEAF
jgi:hypothetical protein